MTKATPPNSDVQAALIGVQNLTLFARTHNLSRRTLQRVKTGGEAHRLTLNAIEAALKKERRL